MSRIIKKIIPGAVRRKIIRLRDLRTLNTWKKNGKPTPVPHIVKQLAIEDHQRLTGAGTLVETGTFAGDMVEAQRKNFRKIYSIELSEELYRMAAYRFRNFNHIEIIQGDSAKILQDIVSRLDEPAIFWLDGHFSGAYAGGVNDMGKYPGGMSAIGEKDCPVMEELEAIFSSDVDHCILVDDARCFGRESDYPSIEEVKTMIREKREGYSISVSDDIIRIIKK